MLLFILRIQTLANAKELSLIKVTGQSVLTVLHYILFSSLGSFRPSIKLGKTLKYKDLM